jgi:hypothetical protein
MLRPRNWTAHWRGVQVCWWVRKTNAGGSGGGRRHRRPGGVRQELRPPDSGEDALRGAVDDGSVLL